MKIILILILNLLVINGFALESRNSVLRGKIFQRDGLTFVSTDPSHAVGDYQIQWMPKFPIKKICYYNQDRLCPDYLVFYKTLKNTSKGPLLVDAVADVKF
jgi:hypothetical protein